MMLRSPRAVRPSRASVTKLLSLRQTNTMSNSFGLLLLLLLLLVLPGPLLTDASSRSRSPPASGGSILSSSGPALDCSRTQKIYVNKGLPMEHVSGRPMPGNHLTVCSGSMTCCSKAMEHSLVLRAAQDARTAMVTEIRKRLTQLNRRRNDLDVRMKKILEDSYTTLHKMFAKTYGYIYLSHSNIFKEFYNSMRRYFEGDAENMGKRIDDFFLMLQERMLPMMEKDSRTDANLRKCLLRELSRNRPFGSVPDTIKTGMRRTLVTSRTFIMVMSHMRDLLQRILDRVQATLSRDCLHSLTRLNMCSLCAGVQARPCTKFCNNVMRGCLYQLYDIIPSWQRMIKSMQSLSGRMSGPLSIEISLNSLGVKVSDGIMNFQKSYTNDSRNKLRNRCRMPRGKRSVPVMPAKARSRDKFGWKYNQQGREMAKLVRQIESEVLRPLLTIWSDLMTMPCKKAESRCWNGTALASYESALVRSSLKAQISNPEVAVDTSLSDPNFSKAKTLMNTLTNSINRALFNHEVDWIAPSPVSTFYQPRPNTRNLPREEGSGSTANLPRGAPSAGGFEGSGDPKPLPKSTNGPTPVTRPAKPPINLPPDDDDAAKSVDPRPPAEGSGLSPVPPTGQTRPGSTRNLPSPTRQTGPGREGQPRPGRKPVATSKPSQPPRPLPESNWRPGPDDGSGSWATGNEREQGRTGGKPRPVDKPRPSVYNPVPPDFEEGNNRPIEGSGRGEMDRGVLPEGKDQEANWPIGKEPYPSQVWVPKNPNDPGEPNGDNYNMRQETGGRGGTKDGNSVAAPRGSIRLVLALSVTVLFLGLRPRTDG